MRPLKFLAGLLLLPLCWAVTRTLIDVVAEIAPPSLGRIPLETWWLLGGFVLWLLLYLVLPRPFRTYVLAHELTHAFWGFLMGARVSGLRVARSGGSVRVSKTNVWITLAPYFFPFYTVCVLMLYGLLSWRYDLTAYTAWWLAAVGFTWSFHVTFTLSVLMQEQPDIQEHGRVFSYVVIYLLNVAGVAAWIVTVTPADLADLGPRLWSHTRATYLALAQVAQAGWAHVPTVGK